MIETLIPPSQQKDGYLERWGGWLAGFGVILTLCLVWAMLTFAVYPDPSTATPQVSAPKDTIPPKAAEKDGFPGDAASAVAARGQFGDMFGFANALFSGLAFTALVVSLAMQRKELAMQRVEIAEARQEMARQSRSMEEQAESMREQAQIALLSARINGQTALLETAASSLTKDELQRVIAARSSIPHEQVLRYFQRMDDLMSDAKHRASL